jgi:hypothetical protein
MCLVVKVEQSRYFGCRSWAGDDNEQAGEASTMPVKWVGAKQVLFGAER